MREIINVNGIDCEVEYNDMLYSRADIEEFLKAGLKDINNLEKYTTEFELLNYKEVADKAFPVSSEKVVEVELEHCGMSTKFGDYDLAELTSPEDEGVKNSLLRLIKRTYQVAVEPLGNNKYKITGSEKAINKFLKAQQ